MHSTFAKSGDRFLDSLDLQPDDGIRPARHMNVAVG
jgi:hypothetical protein